MALRCYEQSRRLRLQQHALGPVRVDVTQLESDMLSLALNGRVKNSRGAKSQTLLARRRDSELRKKHSSQIPPKYKTNLVPSSLSPSSPVAAAGGNSGGGVSKSLSPTANTAASFMFSRPVFQSSCCCVGGHHQQQDITFSSTTAGNSCNTHCGSSISGIGCIGSSSSSSSNNNLNTNNNNDLNNNNNNNNNNHIDDDDDDDDAAYLFDQSNDLSNYPILVQMLAASSHHDPLPEPLAPRHNRRRRLASEDQFWAEVLDVKAKMDTPHPFPLAASLFAEQQQQQQQPP